MYKRISDTYLKNRARFILNYAKPHWKKFAILFACIIATNYANATFNYIFGKMIDEVFIKKNLYFLYKAIIIYAVIFTINQCLHYMLNMSWADLVTKFLCDIRTDMFNITIRSKAKRLVDLKSGDVISRINKDVEEIMTLIHWNIFYTIGGAINIVVSMVYVAHINVVLALIIILMTPASVYAARIYSNKAKRYQKLLKEKSGKVSSLLYEIVRGIREIKLLSAQNVVTEQYMKQNKEAVRQTVTVNIISTKSERVNAAISLMAQMVLFVVSSMLINRSKLTIGGFVSCVGYFTTCVNCLSNINDRIQSVASNIASIDRVIEVYETEREDEEDFRPSIQVENGDILFSNVKFAYRKSNEVLTNVSLHIMAGKKIALVGKSGSGKSTLAALLLRFYDPTEGEIYIDGKNIREFNLMSLRRQGWVCASRKCYV